MKTLEIKQLEEINGGSVANVISGACAAVALSGLIGIIVLNNPVGYGVRGACLVHTVGRGMDWW
jgi:hypothetical protein